MIASLPSLAALGEALRRAPVAPLSVVDLFERQGGYLAFRAIVREVLPEAEAEILAATEQGGDRESARVWAFLQRIEAAYFPVYDADEYDHVVCGIPFVRNAWSYERFHDLTNLSVGEMLLFALCAQPYEGGHDSRVSLLDAVQAHVPRTLLADVPTGGLTPAELHERLDGTPYAAAADYAEWLWGDTGSVFLDVDDEVVVDVDWTRENVLELAQEWEAATGVLDRSTELAGWLEADPAPRFEKLLDAALGRDAHLNYERMRRFYACEITEQGLVAVPHDEASDPPDHGPSDGRAVPLPLDAAA